MRKGIYVAAATLLVMLATVASAAAAGAQTSGWDGSGAPPIDEQLPDVSIIPTACPYSAAPACSDGMRIWNDQTGDPDLVIYRTRHEMGHVQDRLRLDKGERDRFTQLFGFPHGTDWSQGTWPNVNRSPDELFAEAFATCSLGMKPNGPFWIMNAYNYEPTPRQQRLVCSTMSRALSD